MAKKCPSLQNAKSSGLAYAKGLSGGESHFESGISMDSQTTPLEFDRITYRCTTCQRVGIIKSAGLALTAVCLEGVCPHCGTRSVRRFELLTVDRWLHDEVASPETEQIERSVVRPIRGMGA